MMPGKDNFKELLFVHLFVNCEYAVKLWTNLKKWCKYFYNLTIDLEPVTIILNLYSGKEKFLINAFIIYASNEAIQNDRDKIPS